MRYPMLFITCLSGCVLYSDTREPAPPSNAPPYLNGADAGVVYDSYIHDDIWYFEASVDDADGVYDISEVWADVYDDYYDELIESFELAPTSDAYIWYSEWPGRETILDPYYGNYSADIYVYDSYGDYAVSTIYVDTY